MVNVYPAAVAVLAVLAGLVLYARGLARTRRALRRCEELQAQLDLFLDCSRTLGKHLATTRAAAFAGTHAGAADRQGGATRAEPLASATPPTFASMERAGVEPRSPAREVTSRADGSERSAEDVVGAAAAIGELGDGVALSHTERQLLARLSPGLA